ncbi:DsrE family protein [Nitratidesulfovibrio sp. SRB-5]|jgi:intracellular sulfur oxidation DsrE/DsrF family protein|uniref:Uncharacterized protein n=1 Tax=Nitratidesulfovibrio vulgaris (strain DSM 19637 / Miyazaki F) TaxID=883 RepID=B8DNJ1_NITV9|nr:DsrE family protein [Nitratidesulfovibrio sp. SRB-5]MBZ2171373.1 DsrE family protein [Nitratidesulfovibrio sp. SRB-5]RXF77594.1 hypothetical protein EKK70_05705 [Desulfovibrio sp. DS-1]
MHYDIVFHFDNGPAELNIAISNVRNYHKALEGESFTSVLVVNGPGIRLMGADDPDFAEPLRELRALGLDIRVCANAMRHFGLDAAWLNPACTVVPAGIVELVDLQRKGYAYVKP